MAAPDPDLQYATAPDGLRLAYRRLGTGGDVVLVPAGSWLGADLEPLVGGRTLVLYDIRSQGRSDHATDGRIGFERDVEDLEAVRRASGAARVQLLGWSYYGAVAARYAFAHPERVERMALLAPVAPRAAPHWRGYLDNFARRLDGAALRRLEQERRAGLKASNPGAWCRMHTELILRVYVADPATLAHMRSSPCVAPNLDPEVVNQQTLRVLEAMGDYDWRAEMKGFALPALVVHGDRDPVPLAGSVEWAETLADVRLEVLEGCGHMPWLEQPARLFPLLDAFLAGRPLPETPA